MPTKRVACQNESIRNAKWQSVSQIPGFPFASFSEFQEAIKARQCFLSARLDIRPNQLGLTCASSTRLAMDLLAGVPFLIATHCVVIAVLTAKP